jgi:arabinofuranosyltransferase
MRTTDYTKAAIFVVLAGIFIMHALSMSFTQDDAYISYRYVQNYLDGHGLVFNEGERVEGYTNFLFIIIMILSGLTGANYILVSKIIGIISGIGVIFLFLYWFDKKRDKNELRIIPILAAGMFTANTAAAYWSISGLETMFFTFLIFLGLLLLVENRLIGVPVLALAALTRPEGAFIFGLALIYRQYAKEVNFRRFIIEIILFAALILPQFIFRMVYYGDILPNPFYAKTGWSWDYIETGLDYVWTFMKHYGFFGILVILPFLTVKALPRRLRMLLFIVLIYIVYIVMVGGDVLFGYRFFIVLLPLLYVLFVLSLEQLTLRIPAGGKFRMYAQILVISAGVVATFFLPRERLESIRGLEKDLVESMTFQAETLKKVGGDRLTIACTTIGAFGYFSKARIIDMLGLTDREIAKNAKSIEGLETTWKERNYNIPYVMKREPDLILFSTGLKPSAPAERALFLSSKFRECYYPVFHESAVIRTIYRKIKDCNEVDTYYPSARFVSDYVKAINLNKREQVNLALDYANRSISEGPPDFYMGHMLLAEIYFNVGENQLGAEQLQKSFDISDGYAMMAAHQLGRIHWDMGDSTKAEYYYQFVRDRNRIID